MNAAYRVGIDVGGTKILGGLVDCTSGALLSTVKLPTPAAGVEPVLEAVGEAIERVLEAAPGEAVREAAGIGLGLPGQVDAAAGVLRSAPNLGGGMREVAFGAPMQARFSLPVVLGNDVEVAAIGESRFGAGRGVALFACVFVGTGVGGALVQDGARYRGATGSAGEIGHIMVHTGGRRCGCGQRGHLEAYASRTAIVGMLREAVGASR
jgi:glucokinase